MTLYIVTDETETINNQKEVQPQVDKVKKTTTTIKKIH